MKITTNNHWNIFRTLDEIPTPVLADYEHLKEDEGELPYDGWIFYRKRWFHVSDFLRMVETPPWNGYCPDGYFSGTLLELSEDGESYKIGWYLQ